MKIEIVSDSNSGLEENLQKTAIALLFAEKPLK